ncbi:MAG: hypothetical protein QXJ19_06865 [Candidatus Bathyarchaeia archaeon]|nr:hypothetical protein [Candidatus Bathyarchaeota archaeon]
MLCEFELWFLPSNLRAASERAASLLKSINYDVLYLNVPHELSWLVNELALGAPYENFIEEIERLNILRESIVSWEYRFKPIFLAIRGLKSRRPGSEIICYRSSVLENQLIRVAEEVAAMILRVNISGKVDVEEWRRILSEITLQNSKLINDESSYIFETWIRFHRGRRAICILDYPARSLVSKARRLGIRAALRYIYTPYYFTPLELLVRELAIAEERKLNISDERVRKLVKMHAEFIRNYILTSADYDEAYFKWLMDGHYKQYCQETLVV